jgi:large subunit ribosomal protein L18
MKTGNKRAAHKKFKRALRVRQSLRGTPEKPRLCVVKSNLHVYAQLIDDVNGVTLAAASTAAKEVRGTEFGKRSKASGKMIGEAIAQKAKGLGVTQVVFDRGPFKYHGILASLADAAREQGLQF